MLQPSPHPYKGIKASWEDRLLTYTHTGSLDLSRLLTCALAWGEWGDFFTLNLKSGPTGGSNSGTEGYLQNYWSTELASFGAKVVPVDEIVILR
jgi:hypothetical protein